MSRTSPSTRRRGTSYPVNTWYVIATKDEVGRQPLARRALETPVVLYRTQDGRRWRWRTVTPTGPTR